jgi:hypothetical protein
VGVGKTMCIKLRKMTGANMTAAETDFTISVLYTNRNASTAVDGFCERKTDRMQKMIYKFSSLQIRLLSSFGSNIVYLYFLF